MSGELTYPSDTDVHESCKKLDDAVRRLFEGVNIGNAILQLGDWATSIDMKRVEEEYERLLDVLHTSLGESATEPIAAIKTQLFTGWSGPAADAFADYFERMDSFVAMQKDAVKESSRGLVAMYALGASVRIGFKQLADDATSNINQFISDTTTKGWATVTKVLGGVVSGAYSGLPGGPEGATIGAIAGMITGAVEVGTANMGGQDANQILNSVTGTLTNYFESFDNALAQVAQQNRGLSESVVNDHLKLFEPLPVAVDIDSPNFSYVSFTSTWENSSEFVTDLDKERKAHSGGDDDQGDGSGGKIQTRLLGDPAAS